MAEGMPKGEAIVTIFSDFHAGLTKSNNEKGFGLERAYVGYKQKLNKNWELKAVIDFGQSEQVEDHHRIGFIKNAQVLWKRINGKSMEDLFQLPNLNYRKISGGKDIS